MSRQFQFKLVLLGAQTFQTLYEISLLSHHQVNPQWASLGEHNHSRRSVRILNPAISLVLRFVKDQFDDYRESTIGGKPSYTGLPSFAGLPDSGTYPAAFLTQTVQLDDATTVKFEIWYA